MGRLDVDRLDDREADDLLNKLIQRRPLKELASAKDDRTGITYLGEWIDAAQELVDNEGKIFGLETGIRAFDELSMGLKGGDLIVLAGQTSHGKSLMGVNIAYSLAIQGIPVMFTTLEMTKARTTQRFMSIAKMQGKEPAGLPVIYQEETALDYNDIGLLIAKAKKENAKLIIVDHLHFFPRGISGNTAMEIGRITKHFKEVAVAHDIPVILISHVNRLADPKMRPGLNNLKESGYIEQDADSVFFVWKDLSVDGDSSIMELYIAKSRNDGFPNGRKRFFKQDKFLLNEIGSAPAQPMYIPRDW